MRSTRGWSITAKGVYREMLDAQWDMGALPAESKELAILIGATPAEWRIGWAKCESKFPISEDGQRRNWRLESHRVKSADLTERRQNGAAKTNALRSAQRADSAPLNGTDSVTHSARSAQQPARASDPIRSDPIKSRKNPQRAEDRLETVLERQTSKEMGAKLPGFSKLVAKMTTP